MRKPVWTVVCLVVAAFFWVNLAAAAQPVVRLIATGGTIAMKIDPVKKAPVPAISGEDLLATFPDISKYATVEVENLSNVPSDCMDAERWVGLQKAVKKASPDRRLPAWSLII